MIQLKIPSKRTILLNPIPMALVAKQVYSPESPFLAGFNVIDGS